MKILATLCAMRRFRKPVVLAAGFFDGVHLGHRRVLERTVAEAKRLGAQAWALTFNEHPLSILRPDAAPPLLTATAHKIRLLAETGLDGVVMPRFTRRLAATPAEAFVHELLVCVPSLAALVVGRDWAFGRGGMGNAALLMRLLHGRGLAVLVIPPLRRNGALVSSTRIRGLVARGALKEAAVLLGRPFGVRGTVVHGRGMGRKLGAPTANLNPHHEVRPPDGVYAAFAMLDGAPHQAVISIGTRPTFRASARRKSLIEAHLLDGAADLYGRELEIFFVERLRSQRRFASPAALQAQIRLDIEASRILLERLRKKVQREGFTNKIFSARVRGNSKQ